MNSRVRNQRANEQRYTSKTDGGMMLSVFLSRPLARLSTEAKMIKSLLRRLTYPQPFAEHEHPLELKFIFLNSVFLLGGLIALGMGLYYRHPLTLVTAIDIVFALLNFALLFYLQRHIRKVELVGSMALWLSALFFLSVYLLTPDTSRLSLFFLLQAGAFYLQGLQSSFRITLFSILVIVTGHWLPQANYTLTNFDIVSSCAYLITLYATLWNYERLKEVQQQRLLKYEVQNLLNERWQLALEGAGDAIWDWDVRADTLRYSKSFAEMLGYAENEIGQNFSQLRKLIHLQDAADETDCLVCDTEGYHASERHLRCKDGSYKWILCRGRVIQRDRDGRPLRMAGTHVDIDARKLAEEALRRSEAQFRHLVNVLPIGISMHQQGKVVFVNQKGVRIIGAANAGELLGNSLIEHVHPDFQDFTAGRIRAAMEQGVDSELAEEKLVRTDGTVIDAEVSVMSLSHDDSPVTLVMFRDITLEKRHKQQLDQIAHYDALTGAPNRILLADRMTQALAHAQREQELIAVCFVDLDGFKPINDNYGHEAGDEVLVEITRRIREVIRENDTVARLGGDEFVVLLVGLKSREECHKSLNRLLETINRVIEVHGRSLNVSASIGVSFYPTDAQDVDSLIRYADQSMYIAKQSGKNCYYIINNQ